MGSKQTSLEGVLVKEEVELDHHETYRVMRPASTSTSPRGSCRRERKRQKSENERVDQHC